MRFGTVKKRFPTAHIDKATGTSKEIRDYVCKQGKWADTDKAQTSVEGTFKEFGTLPILLGGSTGSGKSVLLKLLLMQAIKKGAVVSIADFKGGVDFPPVWHKQCQMCIEEESTLSLLTELVDELQRRKT